MPQSSQPQLVNEILCLKLLLQFSSHLEEIC